MPDNSSQLSFRTWSSSSRSSRSYRVDVIIEGSKKIAIPLDPSATFSDLLDEAVRRANVLKLSVPRGKLIICLDSEDGAQAFPEDPVLEILDFDQRPSVWLCSSERTQDTGSTGVAVRWITPSRAIDNPTLSAIPVDSPNIPKDTTISDLKLIAKQRTYFASFSNESPYNPLMNVALYLGTCGLVTTDADTTTISDVFNRNIPSPLDIFVVPVKDDYADAESPQNIWAFDYSKHGMTTFLTCLKALVEEIRNQNSTHRRYLRALFNITHFLPALEALQILKDANKLEPAAVCVLATCFREMALRISPLRGSSMSMSRVLEVSRQIFAWIETHYLASLNEVDDPEAGLVRPVFLDELEDGAADHWKPGNRYEIVQLQGAGWGSEDKDSSSPPRGDRLVIVSVPASCREDLKVLAVAMWGRYSSFENYYIDFRRANIDPFEHRRIPLVELNEFPALLKAANQSEVFRIVPPTELDECYRTVISLSKDGYVSRFGILSGDYKEQKRYFWNAVTGTVNTDSHPGKDVEKALQPIITQRKLEGSWDLDDWDYASVEIEQDFSAPQEAIVICFDLSGSMSSPIPGTWADTENDFKRLDEARQVFEHVIARMLGYQLRGNFVGVITFSGKTQVNTTLEISRLAKRDFKDMIPNFRTTGCTALWDAMLKAKDMLLDFQKSNPKTNLRIIAITDGEDNDSTKKAGDVCRSLYEANIVVDSIAIGMSETDDLFKISKHTGGYAFKPTTRFMLFQIPLVEPFLDIAARPDLVRTPVEDWDSSTPKDPDMQSIFDIPQCRKHHLEDGSFIFLQDARRLFGRRPSSPMSSSPYSSLRTRVSSVRSLGSDTVTVNSDRSSISTGRAFMTEITHAINNGPDYADIYINESDMSYWKIVMDGPADTPYAGGTFVLSVHLTNDFPQHPPITRFLTPVLHPNVTKNGRICHEIFREKWQSSYHVITVLEYMHDLLKNPEIKDAVDEFASLRFWTDLTTANREIRNYVERFSKKTRAQWKLE